MSNSKIGWGILGTSKFATDMMIPSMQASETGHIVAIASRSLDKSVAWASRFKVQSAYGSYLELLADPKVEAVYVPLPNHMHVQWAAKALESGKHVLCEKPLALKAAEVDQLIALRDKTGLIVQEAAMTLTCPRWLRARDLVREDRLGPLRAIIGSFSNYNDSEDDIRNQAEMGGGSLLDLGFYPITMSRFLYEREPTRVMGLLDYDLRFRVDKHSTVIMDFDQGRSIFTCSTRSASHQSLEIIGERASLVMSDPWTMSHSSPTELTIRTRIGSEYRDEIIELPRCNQWEHMCNMFCQSIQNSTPAPIPLEDSAANARVIEAIFRSSKSGGWVVP
jgi:predicted dehydrogenase